jgi:hypothetical protein
MRLKSDGQQKRDGVVKQRGKRLLTGVEMGV